MKKLFIIATSLLLSIVCFSQPDSIRTRNNKPGTPSSLRTPYVAPPVNSQIIKPQHLVNRYTPPRQSIYHGGTESADVVHKNNSNIGPVVIGGRSLQLQNKPVIQKPPVMQRDSFIVNPIDAKPPNVTSPIRK